MNQNTEINLDIEIDQNSELNQNFTALKLLKFALPTMIMMGFLSLYSMVDGLFVSNFVGEIGFSALNIVYPYITISIAIATMFSSGGSAFVSKLLGENKDHEANKAFTLITISGFFVALALSIIGVLFTDKISTMLGATPVLLKDAHTYLFILALFSPAQFLQILGQMFFVVAGKPKMGLFFSVGGGVLNIILDYILIVVFPLGIAGAAIATVASYCLPAIAFVIYFATKKTGLKFAKPSFNTKTILKTCANGSSEMVTNLSNSVTNTLFNIIIIVYAGEMGVAAVGVLLYAQFFLLSLMIGYAQGVAPVIGYSYGAKNYKQLKNVFKISLWVTAVCSLGSFLFSFFGAELITMLFMRKGTETFAFTASAFSLFSLCYIFMGTNIFASAFFTALSNGKVSAILSFLRTFVFLIACLLALPPLMGLNGIWLAMPLAELLALLPTIICFVKYRKKYHY